MDTALFLGYALGYATLLAWGWIMTSRRGWWTPANLPMLVVAGLVYDNAIIGVGRWIGEGSTLEALNLARFWIHAFVTPVLVAWGLHALRRAGFGWAQARWYQVVSILSVLVLVVIELLTEVRGLNLVPEQEYGVLSYSNAAASSGPPIMVLVVDVVLLVVGAMVWSRQRWPWLFIGALVMTIGSVVELPVDSGAITNAFELALVVSIVATIAFQDRVRTPGAGVTTRDATTAVPGTARRPHQS